MKSEVSITPHQCTLGPQKLNWVISGLMFTSDFNFNNIWTVFHKKKKMNGISIYDSTTLSQHYL